MTSLLQVRASNWKYAFTLCAHMLSQIIFSINSLWLHFTGYVLIISWQFAGWQEGKWRKKYKHKTARVGIGTWQSVRTIYHSVKLHWLLQLNYLQCTVECWREYPQQIKLGMKVGLVSSFTGPVWCASLNRLILYNPTELAFVRWGKN